MSTGMLCGTSRRLSGISFINVNTGTIVGDTGTVIHTTNGGISWSMQNSGTNQWLFDASYLDINNGFAVGNSGTILRTTNGGVSWVQQNSGVSVSLYGLSFINLSTCTVVGAAGNRLSVTSQDRVTADIGVDNFSHELNPFIRVRKAALADRNHASGPVGHDSL